MAKLTTTSYAILGLLQRRPWSAYELTKYMQHSGIRAVWPRTESRIYVEFKNLVAHGLATATEEKKKGRQRSVYRITPDGRKALKSWLKNPEGGLRLESEPLLKLLYGDIDPGSPGIQLEHMNQQLLEEVRLMRQEMAGALEDGFFFDDNAIHNAQLVSLLTNMLEARTHWLIDMNKALGRRKSSESATSEARKIYRREARRLEQLMEKLES